MSIFNRFFGRFKKSDENMNSNNLEIEKLLFSDDINGSIIELDNQIGELCNYGDEMEKLTEPQKLFYLNQCLEREVNNGGFYLYFHNSSGNFSHQTINSLIAIGAKKTVDILQRAIDQFPNSIVPQDRIQRQLVLEQILDISGAVWEELNQEFFAYEDNLNSLNIEYVRKNKDYFT